MKRLGDILGEVTARYRWQPAEALMEILAAWPLAVSPEMARVAVPVGYLDGTLTVAVPSSVWTQELSYLREPLMERLNAALESVRVKRLRLVVRAMPPPRAIDVERLRRLQEQVRERRPD